MITFAFVTGSRSDYGYLKPLMNEIKNEPEFDIQILVTGMHLSPEFGYTVDEIKGDNLGPIHNIESLLSSDTKVGIGKSIAIGVLGILDQLQILKPDYMILLGDRFESYAAALAALHCSIPIIHIHGGDVGQGVLDDYYRHSITKFASIHFAASIESLVRILLLGENPNNVYLTGSPTLDDIASIDKLSKEGLAKILDLEPNKLWITCVYHPTNIADLGELEVILFSLIEIQQKHNIQVVIIYPNADAGSRKIISAISNYKTSFKIFKNLERNKFINLLSHSICMIGNSSAGIIEAPFLDLPVINIGNRQLNRTRSNNVFDVETSKGTVLSTLNNIIRDKDIEKKYISPYGKADSCKRMVTALKEIQKNKLILTESSFYDNTELVVKIKDFIKKEHDFDYFKEKKSLRASEIIK